MTEASGNDNKSFRVIQIINTSTIVVNAGKKDGIDTGLKCEVFADTQTIIDPQTHTPLGDMELFKGRGVVTQVYEKFCVVRSYKQKMAGFIPKIFHEDDEYIPFQDEVTSRDIVRFIRG